MTQNSFAPPINITVDIGKASASRQASLSIHFGIGGNVSAHNRIAINKMLQRRCEAVAPRCARAAVSVLEQHSLKPLPEAEVMVGSVALGTRRGAVELDWAAVAPDEWLPPRCAWQQAAGARADGSGVRCPVVATLPGYAQVSEDRAPGRRVDHLEA